MASGSTTATGKRAHQKKGRACNAADKKKSQLVMMMRQAAYRRDAQAQEDSNKKARTVAQAKGKSDKWSMPRQEVQFWDKWSKMYTQDSIASTAGIAWDNSKASLGY